MQIDWNQIAPYCIMVAIYFVFVWLEICSGLVVLWMLWGLKNENKMNIKQQQTQIMFNI